MADSDMAENGNYPDDLHSRVGVQSQRIANIEVQFADFRRELGSFVAKMDERFNSMSTAMAERSRPQWQAIGVALTFAVVIGGMAYWPIRESTTDLKATVAALAAETNQSIRLMAERAVTREELDWRAARSGEDRTRTENALAELRDNSVTRNEWGERNLSRDHEITNMRESQVRADSDLQRQIDQNRQDFQTFASSMGNGRDIIQTMQDEIKSVREQFAEFRARLYRQSITQPPPER